MRRYVLPDGQVLFGVHDPSLCEGRHCVIHNPSEHHLADWPLHWRQDRGIFERICPHGVGHPDPDNAEYFRSIGADYENIHGCDLREDGSPCCEHRD